MVVIGVQMDFGRKFTDYEYLTRKEVSQKCAGQMPEQIWKLVGDYRNKYKYPLDIKRFDRLPFSIVLTASILANINEGERNLFSFAHLYNQHYVKQSISEIKSCSFFTDEMMTSELICLAHSYDILTSEREIEEIISNKSKDQSSFCYRYFSCIKELRSHQMSKISRTLIKELSQIMNSSLPSEAGIYLRVTEPNVIPNTYQLSPDYDGAPVNRINELLTQLLAFYESDYDLSPLIISAIIFTYFVYIAPLPKYNYEVGMLLLLQNLAISGFGESVFSLPLLQIFQKEEKQFLEQYDEVRRTGDITYMVLFVSKMISHASMVASKILEKIPFPSPLLDEVRIIEKIVKVPVETIVEKEVPIEVIRTVYVDREVEKIVDKIIEKEVIVEIPTTIEKEVLVEKIIEIPIEVERIVYVDRVVEKPVFTEVETIIEKPIYMDRIVEKTCYEEVEKIVEVQVDKIVEVPIYVDREIIKEVIVEKIIEVPIEIIKEVEKIVYVDKEVIKEVVIEKEVEIPPVVETFDFIEDYKINPVHNSIKETQPPQYKSYQPIKDNSISINNLVLTTKISQDQWNDATDEEIVKYLIEIDPTMRLHQAQFYSNHRFVGRFYTISQFKEFAGCSYETARTSMDYLTSIGLYRKEALKNKFVYTPNEGGNK